MLKTSILAALALGTLATATPAAAENAAQNTVTVSYADLDLKSEAGRKALDSRLAHAARKVCGGTPSIRDIRALTDFRSCLATTKQAYAGQRLAALNSAGAKRVAVLADKLGYIALR